MPILNPAIDRTAKSWPRCGHSLLLPSRGQPLAAAHLDRYAS